MDSSKNDDAEAVITINDDGDDDDDDDNDDCDIEESVYHGNLEFCVSEDKVEDVNNMKKKVLELYGVTIKEDIKAKETDDKNAIRQWFSIVGPLEKCREAKAFIFSSCDPGQAAIFEFDPMLHRILSSESQKMRIEKESKALLLFDSGDEGTVVIQGADEISVGVAMSLLEAVVYEASIALMSPSKEPKALCGKGDEILAQSNRRQTELYARTAPGDRMEVDIIDLELATGEVALDVMKSLDPEIQRLVKCGRDKNYTDEEIREVLEKSSNVPKASDFFRALHTCRNVKALSSESRVHQTPVTNKNDILDDELCEDIDFKRRVRTVENKEKHLNPVQKDVLSASVLCSRPVSNLISISDAEERKRQAEVNQRLNRKLFVEQSSASAIPKSYSYDRVTNLDDFPLPGDVNASDSGLDINSGSPSGRKRHKKKKKKKNADLIADSNDYRSRSPPNDRDETTLRSNPGQQSKEPNTATAPITQAGHLQSEKMSDNLLKHPGLVSQQTANVPASKQVPASFTKPKPPTLLPPFTVEGSRTSVSSQLRYIVIDGSNIAMTHGNGKFFSCRGIEIAVQHFRQRGHKEITVFVPQWRRQVPRFEDQNPIRDQGILEKLKDEGVMNFTPSRRLPGKKNIVCYDDRFILRLAEDTKGIVVSNDNYRDLYVEKPEWGEIIETRVLSFTFVGDRFMLPDDPLGREGPNLDEFLSLSSKKLQPSTHSNSFLQFPHAAPNPRSQLLPSPRFFAQQSTRAFAPGISTGQWQTVSKYTRPGLPNTGYWFRPTHTQDTEQWTNKINHVGIPIQASSFPFRTTSAPLVSNLREPPKFIVERAPSTQSAATAGSFRNQTARQPNYSRQQHMKVTPSPVSRSEAETKDIQCHLMEMFPDQEEQIKGLLLKNKTERNLSLLIDILLDEAEEN